MDEAPDGAGYGSIIAALVSLSIPEQRNRAALADAIAAYATYVLDGIATCDQIAGHNIHEPRLYRDAYLAEARILLSEADDLLTAEHRSRLLVILATE